MDARLACGNQLRETPEAAPAAGYLPAPRGSTGLVLETSDWKDAGTGHPWRGVVGVGSVMLTAGVVTARVVSGPMTGLGTALLLITCAYVGIVGLLFVATRCEVLATGGEPAGTGAPVRSSASTDPQGCPDDDPVLAPSALAAAMFAPDPAR